VTLPGTVHPLAQSKDDRGPVDAAEPSGRILLLLQRPAAKQAAFDEYLREVNAPGSAVYHQWLKPEEIGQRFGPSASDAGAVDAWLKGAGLNIARHSKSGMLVEFTGTVGQLNQVLHTEIHQYAVDGVMHKANSSPLQIPQALAGVVAGVSPLNDFRAQPLLKTGGSATWNAATRKLEPAYTSSNSQGPLYTVTPADFATQYNLGPLQASGVNGSGVTIGIVNESNIDLSLSNAFRTNFGVAANPVNVIVDGNDPGVNCPDSTEAYLDVERAGGTAPNATIDLYIASAEGTQDPLLLSAERAVEDDTADILSVSFGEDEVFLGTSGNALWNELWEQAAAQGQTVVVAAGDSGSSGQAFELSVSGLASTSWDVAVGGTDFYYSDYAQGAPSAANDWNATNDPVTKASLKAPVTEQVWNDAFGFDALGFGAQYGYFYAGGGGVSACAVTSTTSQYACVSGYPKPAWQKGTGVPADSARDVPDVSLFAANGFNYSNYAACAVEGDCVPDANGNFTVSLIGGTSASAPSMAGILALVEQKYGRQGQVNTTLYALAQQKPAAFHDIALGNNETYETPPSGYIYPATAGYDLASGLGTVDAATLVADWNSLSYQGTATTLSLSATSITHGQPVTVTTAVTPATGTGVPTGAVAVMTNSTLPNATGQTEIALNSGTGTATLSTLPGGTYQVTGRYSGDVTFAASSSAGTTLTVAAEKSELVLTGAGANVLYGNGATLSAQVVNAQGNPDGVATGEVSFTLDGATSSSALNVSGVATDEPLFTVGSHTVSASYAGDASYEAAKAAPVTFTVGKGLPLLNPTFTPQYAGFFPEMAVGESLTVGVTASPQASQSAPGTLAPTGSVNVELMTNQQCGQGAPPPAYSLSATLAPVSGEYSTYSTASVFFPNLAAGDYYVCATYNGDANWQNGATLYIEPIIVSGTLPALPTLTISATPTTLAGSQLATLTPTLTGTANGPLPTGNLYFYDNGAFLDYEQLGTGGPTVAYAFQLGVSSFLANGSNQITAVYGGDANYQPVTSNLVTFQITQSADFTLTAGTSSVALNGGASTTVPVTLASVGNLVGTAALTCTSSSPNVTCSFSPTSVSLPGPSVGTLTISAATTSGSLERPSLGWSQVGGTFVALLVFFTTGRKRRMRGLLCALVAAGLMAATGCGSGGTPGSGSKGSTTVSTYTVTATGISAGVEHAATITVVVTTTN
jgi:hypothetical protein